MSGCLFLNIPYRTVAAPQFLPILGLCVLETVFVGGGSSAQLRSLLQYTCSALEEFTRDELCPYVNKICPTLATSTM